MARATVTAHAPTLVNTHVFKATLEVLCCDPDAALHDAAKVLELSREHGLASYVAQGTIYSSWARARLGDRLTGVRELRESIAASNAAGHKYWLPFSQGLLAELESGVVGTEALASIDQGLALAQETGERWTDAFLHRLRGEIILEHDPADAAPAEEAFRTAIAVAQQQRARSFELRAALSLAKLYHQGGRDVDAYTVLDAALEGFSPTPELPEIEQAQALRAELAQTEAV
jgi:adenylate cyclase